MVKGLRGFSATETDVPVAIQVDSSATGVILPVESNSGKRTVVDGRHFRVLTSLLAVLALSAVSFLALRGFDGSSPDLLLMGCVSGSCGLVTLFAPARCRA